MNDTDVLQYSKLASLSRSHLRLPRKDRGRKDDKKRTATLTKSIMSQRVFAQRAKRPAPESPNWSISKS